MIVDPKKLFLVDACGAVLSAFLLGIILTRFERTFGMPRHVLYFLAVVPCFFAIFSFMCYFKMPDNWRVFLKTIAVLNLSYCVATTGLVSYFFQQLTFLGVGYFVIEIIIVLSLVRIELTTSRTKSNNI